MLVILLNIGLNVKCGVALFNFSRFNPYNAQLKDSREFQLGI